MRCQKETMCVQYTIHQDKNVKNISFRQNKGTKHNPFFLLQVPAYHSFNLWFLYDLGK